MKTLSIYGIFVFIGVLIISFNDSRTAIISDKIDTVERNSQNLKKQVELLSSDKDQDGVSDYFDKEPDTPEGYMVYGGGQSVDQDKDGIADDIDEDPFSTKGAKVDADGREFDGDGDGVADEADLETSKAGAFVNFQGVTITDKIGGGAAVEDIGRIPGFESYRSEQKNELEDLKLTVFGFHSKSATVKTNNNGDKKQEAVDPASSKQKVKSGDTIQIESTPNQSTNKEFFATGDNLDSLTRVYNLSLLKHKMRALEHRNGVFEWQLFSSKLIFGIVLLIVCIGLLFSWMQFKQVLGEPTSAEKVEGAKTLNTEMEISQSGLKINSSVIGLIILIISLAFFYLYLMHVYPIELLAPAVSTEIN